MAALRNTLLLVLLASLACVAQDNHERRHEGRRHSGVSKPPAALVEKPAPTPTPQAAPPQPPTPAQSAATAPQVSYRNGLLTVVANNSTLSDILNAVQAKTGASIDYPAGQAQDRVIASYGPAPATQVLASLLSGSRYDYILLGSPGRPDLLSKAILTSKGAEPSATENASASPAPPKNAAAPQPADEDTDVNADDQAVEQPVEQPPPPQPQPPPQQPAQNQPGQPIAPGQGQPKTPEQLLQELQRLQQQQNQQNQQNQQQQQQPPQPPPQQNPEQ